jgi:glycosyltransferase involved in cell wall biosynthesis
MTLEMWFAWLLRDDVRGGRQIGNHDAQKDFVAWWYLYGPDEYPEVWQAGAAQKAVVLEPVWSGEKAVLPRIVFAIWLATPDLQQRFLLGGRPEAVIELLCWYRLEARSIYPQAPLLLGPALGATNLFKEKSPTPGTDSLTYIAKALWEYDAQIRSTFPLENPAARIAYAEWFRRVGLTRIKDRARVAGKSRRRVKAPQHLLTGGINLVGFVFAEFGLGEDIRTISAALDAGGVPHVIIDALTPPGVGGKDRSRQHKVINKLKYAITLFCMSAFDTASLHLKKANKYFSAPYNIGYWPWELPRFPDAWSPVCSLVNEIWSSTNFQKRAYEATWNGPVLRLPAPVLDSDITRRRPERKQPYVFIYAFDPRSYLGRKNPAGIVKAFRLAFPQSDRSVRLILRANGTGKLPKRWREVHVGMRGDSRISVARGTFPRRKALQFLADSDCLVSPHRSEGFGRNIGEAIILGVSVLATGYSGPLDFLSEQEQLPIRSRALSPGDYPFGDGQRWSDPTTMGMAIAMRRIRMAQSSRFRLKRRKLDFLKIYSIEAAGSRYRSRIDALYVTLDAADVSVQRRERPSNCQRPALGDDQP